jgi:hypothetical protein
MTNAFWRPSAERATHRLAFRRRLPAVFGRAPLHSSAELPADTRRPPEEVLAALLALPPQGTTRASSEHLPTTHQRLSGSKQ